MHKHNLLVELLVEELPPKALKKLGEAFEIYWESVHLPSAADMREVYHKLYSLDRKLDDLDKRFRNIEKLLEKQFSSVKSSK